MVSQPVGAMIALNKLSSLFFNRAKRSELWTRLVKRGPKKKKIGVRTEVLNRDDISSRPLPIIILSVRKADGEARKRTN